MVGTPDVMRRPRATGGARSPRRRAPVLVAALVTTGWASIVSYAVVVAAVALVTGVSGDGASVRVVFRYGTAGWLLAHGVPLGTGGGQFRLAPLALTALAAWRIVRAGVHTTRAIGARRKGSFRHAALATGAVAVVYGLLGAVAAVAVNGSGLAVPPLRAGLGLAGFGLLAGGAGALVESGLASRALAALPGPVRDGLRTGLVAALLVLGAGAATAGTAIAVAGGDAGDMLAAYHTGFAGQAGLTALCLAYAPNLATWAAAYLVGPGFAVGTGTVVSAARVHLDALPAVPVLVALPSSAVAGLAALLLGVPMAGGMTAGWLLARRRMRQAADREAPAPTWAGLLAAAALAGPVAGLVLGLLAWVSGGPLGGGRLSVTGPIGWQVALVTTGVVALGALVAASATLVLIGARRP
ncbi:MAG: hypothetical protein V7603_4970 [Micromonosporaceae bacterium]